MDREETDGCEYTDEVTLEVGATSAGVTWVQVGLKRDEGWFD